MDPLELTLPVEELPATVVLADGSCREAELFLAPGQDAEALLAGGQPFVRAAEDGAFRLYGREAIACVSVAVFRARRAGEDAGVPVRRQRVRVRLAGGAELRGELRYLAPPERARPGDFLNEDCPTFALHDSDAIHFVAKRHVVAIEEIRS